MWLLVVGSAWFFPVWVPDCVHTFGVDLQLGNCIVVRSDDFVGVKS